jgi:uncharacterized protein YndB with AHSA1/START domain
MNGPAESLVLVRRIRAPVARVFAAWTDIDSLRRFMCPGQTTVGEIAADIREGGAFRIVMMDEGRPIEHSGVYVRIERPRLLAFTWTSAVAGPDTLVTLTFDAEGTDTVLRLEHERLPSAEARRLHGMGWRSILEKVAALAGEAQTPGNPL